MGKTRDEEMVRAASVVIADGSQFGRRLTRTMLVGLGVRSITEVADGPSALEAVSSSRPDVLITDWDGEVCSRERVVANRISIQSAVRRYARSRPRAAIGIFIRVDGKRPLTDRSDAVLTG